MIGALGLVAIIVGAALLRGWGLLSGQLVWHPDELLFPVLLPLNVLGGDLNPHFYNYPTFHLYTLAAVFGLDGAGHTLFGSSPSLAAWVGRHYLVDLEPVRDLARWVGVAYAVATVWMAAVLAGRLDGRGMRCGTALAAAALMAVNVVHVRQSALASAGAPLAFWYTAATWAALRLLSSTSWRPYLWAGVLVGVCGATKYPGAAAAGGVLAAHLTAGRTILDRRLWLAGAAAVVTFVIFAPYTLIDFDTFRTYFLHQVNHAQTGRHGVAAGPLYQLATTLRYGPGVLGWLVWLAICVWVAKCRLPAHVVLLGALLAGYASIAWGQLVFARYALPLLPLQAVLLADGLARVARLAATRFPGKAGGSEPAATVALVVLVTIVAIQPLRGSVEVARLQTTLDTRTEVREWIETQVPPGSTVCDFDDWAADNEVRTYEDLWLRLKKFAQSHEPDELTLALAAADQDLEREPHYFYPVQGGSGDEGRSAAARINSYRCAYVVTHQHPLALAGADTTLHRWLATNARLEARFDPGPLEGAHFDLLDSYFIPIDGFGARRPGPAVEVWRVPEYAARPAQPPGRVASTAMALLAESEQDPKAARRNINLALNLDSTNTRALTAAARILAHSDEAAAATYYRRVLALRPDDVGALQGLAGLAAGAGDFEGAEVWYRRSLGVYPRDPHTLNNLAVSLRDLGQPDSALVLWDRALDLDPEYGAALFNRGTAHYLSGRLEQALEDLGRAVALAPDSARYLSNAAAAIRAAGQPDRAIELWSGISASDTQYADAQFNIAYTFLFDMRDPARALPSWQAARRQLPEDGEAAIYHARALGQLGRVGPAADTLRSYLQRYPRSPQRAEIEATLRQLGSTP